MNRSQHVAFQNAEGRELAGRLELPFSGKPRAYALFVHCFTCGKDLKGPVEISRALTRHGIAVLRFDFTGLGQSEGAFEETTFCHNVSDIIAAANFLSSKHSAPAILIGHSLGGAAALIAAQELESVQAVCTIGAPADVTHVTHLFDAAKIEEQGSAEVDIGGRPFRISKPFLDVLESVQLLSNIASLKKALLILHSPLDETVSIDHARQLFDSAKHPKSFISLDQADHLISNPKDSHYSATLIAAWASRFVPEEAATESNKLTVQIGKQGFLSEVAVRHHRFVADEPKSVGGDDLGPTPYDFLSAALGACTAMTLRMYADRKKWPLDAVSVVIDHEKKHIEDCEDCGDKGKRIDAFTRSVGVKGELSDEQKTRLLEIADRCPVHRTLESSSEIVTQELEG